MVFTYVGTINLDSKYELPKMQDILSGFDSSENLPGNLRIQLTDYCNENCFFCHNEGSEKKHRLINENLMWKIINSSLKLSKQKIVFTGGEPTLHPKFSEYIIKLRKDAPNSEIAVTTNGTTLENMPSILFEKINKLNVSIHSLVESKYTEITNKNLLHKTLLGLDKVSKYKQIKVFINIVVGKNNLTEVENFIEHFTKMNFKINILDIIGKNQQKIPWNKLNLELEKIRKKYRITNDLIKLKPKIYHSKCNKCNFTNICGEGEYLRVSVEGKLVPCMYRPDLVQHISLNDDEDTFTRKVALGFRRIEYDNI